MGHALRKSRHLPIGLLATFGACLLLAASASAKAADGVSISVGAAASQARRFWTPARMRQARPILAPSASTAPQLARSSSSPAGAGAASPGATASSAIETVPDPTAPGFSQNGAIFIVGRFGTLGRCSGTSVNAPNFSLVITAGHCVHEGRHWLGSKWVFVPGYRFGERPFGTFVAKWLGSTPQWISSGNPNFDVGAAVVSRNEHGQRLADAVGADGIAWNLPPNQVFDVYGYPVAPPFNGSTLQHCAQAPFEGHAFFSFLTPGPLNLAVQCNTTPGASGGGWVIAGNVLNGLTADGFTGDDTDYGPYFGDDVARLFARAAKVK
jgi:V8-like Glu-specific endopeptidase